MAMDEAESVLKKLKSVLNIKKGFSCPDKPCFRYAYGAGTFRSYSIRSLIK